MWEKDIQLEELNTENSASYEEICERYVLSHVPKKDQEGLLGKMDYEKVAEILSYKPELSSTLCFRRDSFTSKPRFIR